MGYTHYWYRKKELDPDRFFEFGKRVLTILSGLPPTTETAGGYFKNHPLKVVGAKNNKPPLVTSEIVLFNGFGKVPKTKQNLGHETFVLERVLKPEDWQQPKWGGRYFCFCKTERKPYDLVVCMVLIAFKDVFSDEVIIASDGEELEWREAFTLYNKLLGAQAKHEDTIRPTLPAANGEKGNPNSEADPASDGKLPQNQSAQKPKMLPETIQTIIDQMGGRGLQGALCYVGATQMGYKCPEMEGECRSDHFSCENTEGGITYDVGLSFRVNGKPAENWTTVVAYEPDDTYSVWLWREAEKRNAKLGRGGEVIEHMDDVYCDKLREVVENMYDRAIKELNAGFIPI